MAYQYLPVGVFHNGNGHCTCRVWAPLKKKVEIVVHRDDERHYTAMQKDERGYWSATLENVFPGTKYRFRLDGNDEYADPASVCQPDGIHGPSEITDRHYTWTDEEWKGLQMDELIIYELHTGTFTPEGTFEGVIGKLDYLKELGITAIELMPVGQFPGTRNWGYDVAFPFAVQHSYGGMNGLKELVNEAHRKGIAVILDVVYNHTGPEGSVLNQYGPYFTGKYKTPWGPAGNFDDSWSFGMRQYCLQNAALWLDECHIDGLRVDAVHAIFDTSAKHFAQEMKEMATETEKKTGRKKLLIAEIDLNNPVYINPAELGGYGWDGQWIDEFHHAIHSVLTKETNGYYSDFGDMQHIERGFRDTYVYSGQYSTHRKKEFGVPVHNPCSQFVVFAQNHDQVGNRMLGERLTAQLSAEALKLVAAAVLLSPYVPLLFMGEEYGEKNPFCFFCDHSLPELKEQIQRSRKEEFSYFGWESDPPDPFADATFTGCRLSWNAGSDQQAATLLRLYQYLIRLRKTHPALQPRDRASMTVYPVQDTSVLAFERRSDPGGLLVVLNFGNDQQSFRSAGFTGKKILDTAAAEWNGPGEHAPSELRAGESVFLHPLSALAFEKN